MHRLFRSLGRFKTFVLPPQSRLLAARNCFITPAYRHREQAHYFDDTVSVTTAWQPYVYFIAAALAARVGARWIIDLGCGNGFKLTKLHPRFGIIGVDTGRNLALARRRFPRGQWIDWDFGRPELLGIDPGVLSQAVVVSSDVIEHLPDPARLLQTIRNMLVRAPFAVLSTPDRLLTRGADDPGPPANQHHIREWSRTEFADLLRASGFRIAHCGLTESNSVSNERKTILAVIGHGRRRPVPAPHRIRYEVDNARRTYARHYGVRPVARSRTDPVTLQLDAALALLRAGRTGDCVQRVQAILAIDPRNRSAMRLLDHILDATLRHAVALHRAGNLLEAEFLYRRVLDLRPGHPLAGQLLSLVEREQL